jgi:FdhD protein
MAEPSVARRGPISERALTRVPADGAGYSAMDRIAVEEPLEIRVSGDAIAVTMRTPGHDRELAMGFLFAEGVIRSAHDVGAVVHCGRPTDETFGNTIDVHAAPGVALASELTAPQRRGTLTTSACGVCGRLSIEDLLVRCTPPAGTRPTPTLALLRDSVEQLRAHQPSFERTGALHAAALLAADGHVLAAHEDVGRHNAVDKAIGELLLRAAGAGYARDDRDATGAASLESACVLVISGRISFEIVQKACVAGIGAVCGISAPTTLAIDLAERCRIALAGFVRDGALNLYTSAARDLVRNEEHR